MNHWFVLMNQFLYFWFIHSYCVWFGFQGQLTDSNNNSLKFQFVHYIKLLYGMALEDFLIIPLWYFYGLCVLEMLLKWFKMSHFSTEERKLFMFGKTRGWVNNDRIAIVWVNDHFKYWMMGFVLCRMERRPRTLKKLSVLQDGFGKMTGILTATGQWTRKVRNSDYQD